MEGFKLVRLLTSFLLSIQMISDAADTISATQFVKDGDTLVSAGGSFELGFFNPGSSKNRYVGIWYKNIPVRTVVWVANREAPLVDASGVLTVTGPGIIVLLNSTNNTIWSSKPSRTVQDPVAQLLDTGNLVVRGASDDVNQEENILWQSSDYPSDTLLPGMKLGKNFATGLDRYLLSWKSSDDPAPGEFTGHCDPTGYPQMVARKGSVEWYRTGSWNGVRFSGMPSLSPNTIYRYQLVFNNKEVYYSFELLSSSVVSRVTLNPNGFTQRWTWPIGRTKSWVLYLATPADNCDTYALCGAYGNCNLGRSPVCSCLDKFVPKYQEDWANTDWSNGCVWKTPLDCNNGDGFSKYSDVKLPDTKHSWYNASMTLNECKLLCLRNCSCMAYANLDIRAGGSGCLIWFGDLIDIRQFPEGSGQDIYIRVASSDSDEMSIPSKYHNGNLQGVLDEGQEIAVKRLSETSRQGLDEFMNEVICISKLQHRNLVKLLGCCIHGDERILIYEYMANKSLDTFIFDETQRKLLDWPKRVCIINGIARGLMYLHQDSRLRIVHRDLKVSNILLDFEMNPKISDFGMARSFIGNETGANTKRVVGTYGYMSPEYQLDGHFSVKSDVFSFGVIVLEIVSGRRNRGFSHQDHQHNLLGHQCPEDRPTMSSVVLMLSSEGVLPWPKQPGFFTERTALEIPEYHFISDSVCSNNECTITLVDA
ncbi:hypothetical protein RJ640_022201, partial [Escallonia rubra]